MNTHESYVSLEIAKLLKQAGFDWETKEFYTAKSTNTYHIDWNCIPVNWNNEISTKIAIKHGKPEGYSAPTLDMVVNWFRKVHDYYISVIWQNDTWSPFRWEVRSPKTTSLFVSSYASTYEDAQIAAIKHCLRQLIGN